MPPSAITVWALPRSDLQIKAVRAPAAEDSTAARRPAPPAPTTITSKSCVSNSAMSEELRILERARRDQPDVQVGQGDPDQAGPRPLRVVRVEPRHELPQPVPHGGLREPVHLAAAQVPAGMTRQRVSPDHQRVHRQDQRAEATE